MNLIHGLFNSNIVQLDMTLIYNHKGRWFDLPIPNVGLKETIYLTIRSLREFDNAFTEEWTIHNKKVSWMELSNFILYLPSNCDGRK